MKLSNRRIYSWEKMAEVSGPSTYVSSCLREVGDESATQSKIKKVPEFAFGWSRYNLRLIGLWPYGTCDKNYQRLLMRYGPPVCSIWLLTFDMIPQVLAPFAYTFVRDEIITLIGIEVGLVGAIARIVVLWRNSKGNDNQFEKDIAIRNETARMKIIEVLAMCLAFLSENWTRNLSTVDRVTMTRNAKLAKRISVGVTLLLQCVYWSYVILRVFMEFNTIYMCIYIS